MSDTSPQTQPTSAYFELPPERRLPAWRLALFVLAVLGVHLAGLFLAFGMVGRQTPAAALPALSVRVLELAPVPPPRLEEPIKVVAPAKPPEVPAAVAPPQPAEPPKKRRRPKPARVVAAPAKKVSPTPLLTAAATAPATTSFAVAPQAPSTAVEAPPAPPPAAPVPVVGARFDADYLRNPSPVYPSASRRLGEEGRVILRVTVSAEGLPERVEIKQTSGFRRLDEAARAAVERWRFVAARRGATAIESSVLVPLQFNLQN
ncbi:TonB family protein [Accumulibacter sp.]|uniref:energy transducer TonB n=1 Tax=Accumulibacter sp. TaxID=2053492 RepID=UPI002C8607E8|nr:TonB family protein [Accumulibacter sp.]HRF05430.1 TonB family protein [Accumulibacter sp.]